MLLNPTGTAIKIADKFHHQFAPPTCPRWLDGINLSSAVRFSKIGNSIRNRDLADALASCLLAQELGSLKSELTDVVGKVAKSLSASHATVGRQLRRMANGEHWPTARYRFAIANVCPQLAQLLVAPWSALYFRSSEIIADVASKAYAYVSSDAGIGRGTFWFSLCALRRAMHVGNARQMVYHARASLEALPDLIANEWLRGRAVEIIDLVHRLLHALPEVLLDSTHIRTDLLLENVLTAEEISLIAYSAPNPAVSLDWDDANLLMRREVVRGLGSVRERYVADRAWNFVEFCPEIAIKW